MMNDQEAVNNRDFRITVKLPERDPWSQSTKSQVIGKNPTSIEIEEALSRTNFDDQSCSLDQMDLSDGGSSVPDSSSSNASEDNDEIPKGATSTRSLMSCVACSKEIITGVSVVDKYFHPHCLRCARCKHRIKLPHYGVINEIIYCSKHYRKTLADWKTKSSKSSLNPSPGIQTDRTPTGQCHACKKRVIDAIIILDRSYHPECLDCAACGRVAGTTKFGIYGELIYCAAHRKKVKGDSKEKKQKRRKTSEVNTGEMRKPIIEQFKPPNKEGNAECFICKLAISIGFFVIGKYFHKRCFRCANCLKKLPINNFSCELNQAICMDGPCRNPMTAGMDKQHIGMMEKDTLLQDVLWNRKCSKCDGLAQRGWYINGEHYHDACFKCATCESSLKPKDFAIKDGELYCSKDFKAMKPSKITIRRHSMRK